ncbi:hypothetical protein QBC41DRAFT_328364 [Cercophora samala]|uniref:Uncharacterized protein n=1 Tax=Cercophora samala TaxID=330535 RepID=A0AA39Z6J9_9PEZI|nr:hypothetical protein QBC41DRAFT_328364 [Cercophora samala]
MGGFKKLHPIVLDGFSHGIQIGQPFDTSWGAAWLTSVYTDIDHELFRNMDPIAFRKIRYGNNVAVLFGALVECAEFYELPSFWHVISQGFSANADAVKAIVTVLVAARKAVRERYPTSGSSQTARSADEWIAFLDQRGRNTSLFQFQPSKEADLRARAAAFFKTQQKQWLNAAWVPLPDQPSSSSTLRSNPRKRSASPPPDRGSKQAKTSSTSTPNLPVPIEAQTKVPLPESTNPPPTSQHLVGIKLPTAPGNEPFRRSSWLLKAPAQPPSPTEVPPPASIASSEHEELIKLRDRISILEKELAHARATPPNTQANQTRSLERPSNEFDPQELKSTLSTLANAVSTIMESSHHIVDGLQSLQNDISSRPLQPPPPPPQQLPTPDPPAFEAKLDAQHSLLLALTQQMALQSQRTSTVPVEAETLEQALELAEKDIRGHRETVMRFYKEMPGVDVAELDRIAGILAAMEDVERRIGESSTPGGG